MTEDKFEDSLQMIPDALRWAESQDVVRLRRFLVDNANIPLYCFGSGGAYSPLEYIILLYESNRAMAKAMTPLAISSLSDETLKSAKVLFFSDTGEGLDEEYVLKRVAKVNPKGLCAVTYDKGDDNTVVKILKNVTNNWFSYSWLTQGNTFISTVSTTCLYALIYKAFTNKF